MQVTVNVQGGDRELLVGKIVAGGERDLPVRRQVKIAGEECIVTKHKRVATIEEWPVFLVQRKIVAHIQAPGDIEVQVIIVAAGGGSAGHFFAAFAPLSLVPE